MKIKKIKINKFRSIKVNSTLNINDKLTVLAGKNGTAKSTILGMLAQPFGLGDSKKKSKSIYTKNYDGVDQSSLKTLSGAPFLAKYSNIFRVSTKTDKAGDHEYSVEIHGDEINDFKNSGNILELDVKSEARGANKKIRFVTNTLNRKSGAGNYPHPVIYLGLQRLRPIATCSDNNLKIESHNLNADDITFFSNAYNQIFTLTNNSTLLEKLNTNQFKGNYFTATTVEYNSEAISSGQDNISQIISAILSFKNLKNILKDNYKGGLLLIDEIDASLHPTSQINLINFLIQSADQFSLQLVITTHSQDLLKHIYYKQKNNASIVLFKNIDNKILITESPDFEDIFAELTLSLIENKKFLFLFEDTTAAEFFKIITNNFFDNYITILNNRFERKKSSSYITLTQLSDFFKNFNLNGNIFIIVDPDVDMTNYPNNNNLTKFPGEECIEKIIYNYLKNLPEENPIWKTHQKNCNKNIFFNNFMSYEKNFLNDLINNNFTTREIIYKAWANDNHTEVENFVTEILYKLNKNKNFFEEVFKLNFDNLTESYKNSFLR